MKAKDVIAKAVVEASGADYATAYAAAGDWLAAVRDRLARGYAVALRGACSLRVETMKVGARRDPRTEEVVAPREIRVLRATPAKGDHLTTAVRETRGRLASVIQETLGCLRRTALAVVDRISRAVAGHLADRRPFTFMNVGTVAWKTLPAGVRLDYKTGAATAMPEREALGVTVAKRFKAEVLAVTAGEGA
jgi:nucleoid DNA-binding protein